MSTTEYDVVIAGAGIVGSLYANKLSQAGLRVLIIEAGDTLYFDRDTGKDQRESLINTFIAASAKVPNAPYPDLNYAPSPFVINLGGYYAGPAYQDPNSQEPQYASSYTRIAGGTTYHWLGTMLRLLPTTFTEYTSFGRAVDWPITYDDLEDWYWKAEVEIGVAGDSSVDLGAPRSGKNYPMPPIYPSYSDRRLGARLAGMTFDGQDVLIQNTPQARNSIPYQDRPPCAGSTNCVPICPIQAKYDATVHLKRALNPGLDPYDNASKSRAAEIRLGAVVTRVLTKDDQVVGIEYKDKDSKELHSVSATKYVLATHAIETPKILHYSAPGRGGVANSSDLVGRYLMDHNIRIVWGYADEPLYLFRGPLSTAGIESLRDGDFRRVRSAFRVEIENIGANWADNTPLGTLGQYVRNDFIGDSLYENLAWDVNRQIQLDALLEPDPQRDSTVGLSDCLDDFGIPRPKIEYKIDDYTNRGSDAFVRLAREILTQMGSSEDEITVQPGYYGAGHSMGTLRMGNDPKTSVADSYGRSHDHPNLWLTGSALFPTVGSANPTLTIAAVTLRSIDQMLKEFPA